MTIKPLTTLLNRKLDELRRERSAIVLQESALAALLKTLAPQRPLVLATSPVATVRKPMSAASRAAVSRRMKRYWRSKRHG